MLLGGPRQLLILGIPTFTLVFGLLVLRHRRRKRGTLHTDPGGIEGKTPNQEPFTDENVHIKNIPVSRNSVTTSSLPIVEEILPANVVGVDSRNKVHPIVASNAEAENSTLHAEKLVLVPQEVPANGPKVALISAVTPEPIVIDLTADSPRKIIDLSTDDSSTDESCYTDREEGELTNSTISDLSSPVEELTSSKSEDSTETDEIADSGKIIEEQKGNELEEGELLDSSGEEGLLESQQLTNKTTVVKDVNSKEESSVKMKKAEQGELVDKLVTLELDAMNMSGGERKDESSERDSANHSPSEVMLASPSISNFSDAHSEGSSDSGKGHSDVALSPSRTPAGGSSLAGDLALSLYEFVLPQNTVGRLIGRHGTSLHEIRSATGANIYIKRHPETNKLKICAIEGTQQDIDKALEKIRQKFPLRRFPQLTLEKVSFVSLNTPPPIKLEDFNLQLIEGVNNDVILSSLISAAHFFLQQPSHPSYSALASLNVVMNTVYNSPEAPVLDPPTQNAVCAAPAMGGWYRAQIMSVDEEHHSSYVKFLDYGGYLLVESNTLRQIRGDFLTLPFQAVECYLANVAPAEGDLWTDEARQYVQALTQGQILQAQIYEHAEDGTPLVYLYSTVNNKVILVNEWLVSAGYAILTAPASLSDQEE